MKHKLLLSCSLALSLVLVSCSSDATTTPSDDTASTDDTTQINNTIQENAETEESVTLLAYDSFTPSEGIFDAFTAATGTKVNVVLGGDAGELVSKAILTAGNPEGDVLWGVDNTLSSRAIDGDIFEQYTSKNTEFMGDDVTSLIAPDNVLTPVDTGDVCVNYDKAWFENKNIAPPSSLADLIKPEYKNLLVTQNPNTSSPGLAFVLATIAKFGENSWQDYWSSLRDNGVKIVDGWTQAYTVDFSGSSGKGDYPLVVSYGSSPPAEVVYADPPIAEPPTGVIESTCFRQVEFAGVLRGAKNPVAARALVDYLTSETFQADLPLTLFVYPVNTKVVLPEVFTKFAVKPTTPLSLSAPDIETNRAKWIELWTSAALR